MCCSHVSTGKEIVWPNRGVFGLVYPLVDPPTIVEEKYGVEQEKIHLLGFILLAIIAFSFVALLKKHYGGCFGITSSLVVLGGLFFIVLVAPLVNPYRSSKALAQRMDAIAAPRQKIVFFAGSENPLCSILVARCSACAVIHN